MPSSNDENTSLPIPESISAVLSGAPGVSKSTCSSTAKAAQSFLSVLLPIDTL